MKEKFLPLAIFAVAVFVVAVLWQANTISPSGFVVANTTLPTFSFYPSN